MARLKGMLLISAYVCKHTVMPCPSDVRVYRPSASRCVQGSAGATASSRHSQLDS
jgi:hypothetical protein